MRENKIFYLSASITTIMRKKLIRSILTLCFCTVAFSNVNAQLGQSREYCEPPGWSVGMSFGLLDLWGDVGTQKVMDHYTNKKYFEKPHFMGGVFCRYVPHPAIGIRLGFEYGTLFADDAWNKQLADKAPTVEDDAYQRYLRNLSVKANTWEAKLLFEISPMRMNYTSASARKRFQPMLLFGVAYMHFKPTAKYIDKAGNDRGYINLADLDIEGAGAPASILPNAPEKINLWQVAIPMGIGVKWDIGRQLALGIEYMYRMTFTDYLDGVSNKYVDKSVYQALFPNDPSKADLAFEMQDRSFLIDPLKSQTPGSMRGNPSVKDGYSTFGISFMFKIRNRKNPWWF